MLTVNLVNKHINKNMVKQGLVFTTLTVTYEVLCSIPANCIMLLFKDCLFQEDLTCKSRDAILYIQPYIYLHNQLK